MAEQNQQARRDSPAGEAGEQARQAEIGIFGGSGFYDLLENLQEAEIETEYGRPSDKIMLGEYQGKKISFLARHGRNHNLPPHQINYRANIMAFKKLGVTRIIAPCAAGSLQPNIKPGDFVACAQFVDRTRNRVDSFFNGPQVAHIAGADPYCPQLSRLAIETANNLGIKIHPSGTVVVINGPRFSTRAESRWFSQQGWEVINMTQYPEAILAREAEICYTGIALITDFDAGLEGMQDIPPVTIEEVLKVFKANNEKAKQLILAMTTAMPENRECQCASALAGAIISK
ncbi:MAG: S-methyl-5'-thioadenosine phosphorylase [bacterium]